MNKYGMDIERARSHKPRLAPNPNRFDTSNFENTHGRKPRGQGYWCFEFHYCDGSSVQLMDAAYQTYGSAKKYAVRASRARFGMRAWNSIEVMP